MKSLLRSPLFAAILGYVLWAWMSLVAHTVRWRVEGLDEARALYGAREPGLIVACWHETILLMPSGWLRYIRHWPERRGRTAMMVSLSPDGAAVSEAVEHLDIDVVRGSASNKKKSAKDKGGLRAIAEASKRLREGGLICMTPDGPRGPHAISARPIGRFGSWDKLIFPLPFARGGIVLGAPIDCPRDGDPEALRQALQIGMDTATRRAEELAGYPAEPSPTGAAV
jgi:lysophospholipid acyltransferase (LPLAT)-like uncharacterized protein